MIASPNIQYGAGTSVVTSVPMKAVTNVADLKVRLEDAKARHLPEVVFFVLRDPDTLFIPVKPTW